MTERTNYRRGAASCPELTIASYWHTPVQLTIASYWHTPVQLTIASYWHTPVQLTNANNWHTPVHVARNKSTPKCVQFGQTD